MKPTRMVLMSVMVLVGTMATGSVLADGRNHRGRVGSVATGTVLAHGGHYRGHVRTVVTGTVLARGGRGGHHRGHLRLGVFIGSPAFWYYPPPVYYYPSVVAVPSSPPAYIERGDAQAAPEQSQAYWYYCADEKTYYPYVEQCPGGWQRVVPQPPPG